MVTRAISRSQLELKFNPPEQPVSHEQETPHAAHREDAVQARKLAESNYIKLAPYKPNSRDQLFRRRVKQERGGKCETCGRKMRLEELCVHHILETRAYPQFDRRHGFSAKYHNDFPNSAFNWTPPK
jgi:hypothetical protein